MSSGRDPDLAAPAPPAPQGTPDPAADSEHLRQAVREVLREDRKDDAEALLRAAVRQAECEPSDPARLIDCLQQLATFYRRVYRHRDREETLTRLLALQEAYLGDTHPDVAPTLQQLAWEIGRRRRKEEAEALYRRALAIDEATYDPGHLHVAGSLRVLGVHLFFSEQYEESAAYLERARSIVETIVAASQFDRSTFSELDAVLDCLRLTYMAWARFAEAEDAIRRRLEIAERYDGDALNIGSILQHLGDACRGQGKYEAGAAYFQRAIESSDRWFESCRRAKRFRDPDSPWARNPLRASRHKTRGWRLYRHGLCLAGLGRADEAKASLYQAERALRKAVALERAAKRSPIAFYDTVAMLLEILRTRGKTREADTLQVEVAALRDVIDAELAQRD